MSGEVKESVRCSALNKNGTRCKHNTLYPKKCGQHTPDLKALLRAQGKVCLQSSHYDILNRYMVEKGRSLVLFLPFIHSWRHFK